MNFKNMKIEVQNNLDEIVGELESKGYQKYDGDMVKNPTIIETYADGIYCFYSQDIHVCKTTTLAELKEMQDASK